MSCRDVVEAIDGRVLPALPGLLRQRDSPSAAERICSTLKT
jgi:hypothetical protein